MPKTLPVNEHVKSMGQLAIKVLLRYHMGHRQLGYAGLAALLNKAGIEENERNLANKIGKGELPAWLFLLCLKVMGVTAVDFSDWPITKDEADLMLDKR